MAVLERMSIRGIRSFGPGEEEKVKFSTPITLFLGQNGSGKTTIIECIKYALCGELPGNSDNGSGFVNDPKLSDKNSIKASIKLKFRDTKGDHVTVGRFLEVTTIANNKLRFKSINPSIKWEDGQKIRQPEEINGRCTDINLYCAQKLNVSKVILNNVIFCHQENTCWALEEDKKVKEKFDEIFGATEYNKAVDNLRAIIKDKKAEIKTIIAELQTKSVTKRNVERQRNQLQKKFGELEDIEKIVQQENDQLKTLENRLKEIQNVEKVIFQLQQELIGLEKTLDSSKKYEIEIKKYLLEEFKGTFEELENEIKNFETNQNRIKDNVREIEKKLNENNHAIINFNRKVPALQETLARLHAEEEQQNQRDQELEELLKVAKEKFEINNHNNASDVREELENKIQMQSNILNTLKQEKINKEKTLQTKMDTIRENCVKAKNDVSCKDEAIIKNIKEIEEINPKLHDLEVAEKNNKITANKIKKLKESLERKTTEFKETEIKSEIKQIDEEIQSTENIQIELDKLYKILNKNYATEQNILHEKNSLTKKQRNIDEIKTKYNQYFKLLFPNEETISNYENSVRKILKIENDKLKTVTLNISKYEKKIISLESNLKHIKDKLYVYEDELKVKEDKINRLCKGESYSNVLDQSYKEKEKLQKEKGTYSSAKNFYEKFINEFEQDSPCCPICDTNFKGKQSTVLNILAKLKDKIDDLPNKLESLEHDLKKEEEFYNNLQQLQPINLDINALKQNKIPNLKNDLEKITEQLEEVQLELVSLKNDKNEPEKLVDACNKIIADMTLLDHCIGDMKQSENTILKLENNLESVPSKKTLAEVENEKSELQIQLRNLKRKSQTKKEYFDDQKKQIQTEKEELHHQIHKNLEKQQLLQQKPILLERIKECKQTIENLKNEKTDANENLSKYEKDLEEIEKDRDSILNKMICEIDEKRSEIECCNRIVNDIQKLQNKIEKFKIENNQDQLQITIVQLETIKKEIQKLEDIQELMNVDLLSKKEALTAEESNMRKLQDNRRLRENRNTITELDNKIADINQQIESNNYRSLNQEKKKLLEESENKKKNISKKHGEKSILENNIKDIQKELNKKENKEAFKEYNKKFYQLKAHNLMITDLEIYTEALEKCILQFHQERMIQINLIIRELWRSIYKGNDIDYIEIKAFDEIGRGKKRKYEYKVVQVKKGVELEMRGRCSVGQRVLACLVIRLALAETFSANCGILALDEPTTNLDRDNIASLCDALSKIINAREKQKNFQLLIITHDEEFLQILTRDQSTSHYYEVKRNPDGFSKLELKTL